MDRSNFGQQQTLRCADVPEAQDKPRGVLGARFGTEWLTLSSVQEKQLLGRWA